jgi:RimJ/RimL family protein N-acetyltransferase
MATLDPRTVAIKNGRTILIRSAAREDAAELLGFIRDVAAGTDQIASTPEDLPKTAEEERRFIEQRRDGPGSLLLVAVHDGRIVGVEGFEAPHQRRLAHTGTLGISIGESWRNCGVGRAMIQTLIDWARTHPRIEKVCLSVFSSNRIGRALYRSLGFVEEGRRRGGAKLGTNRYVDEILMGLWVKNVPPAAGD